MHSILFAALAALWSVTTLAAEAPKPDAKKPAAEMPPPPLPNKDSLETTEGGLEPEVTITTRGELTYEEYRIRGKLYMVKVTPKHGQPYYLIDRDGSGQFRRSDLESTISVPNWVIKRW